jgi:hypothetical protein
LRRNANEKAASGWIFRNFLQNSARKAALEDGPALERDAPESRSKKRSTEIEIMASVPFDQLDGFIWMNGEFVKWADAKIHVLTHGLHYASAVFEG